jgi:hypothetical protein
MAFRVEIASHALEDLDRISATTRECITLKMRSAGSTGSSMRFVAWRPDLAGVGWLNNLRNCRPEVRLLLHGKRNRMFKFAIHKETDTVRISDVRQERA